jgi:hypothetical protein
VVPYLLGIAIQACASGPAQPTGAVADPTGQASARPSAADGPRASASRPASTTSPAPLPPLVGQWQLDRTCDAIVSALNADLDSLLTRAQRRDMIAKTITETIEGVPENGPLPSTWDPRHPCAMAKPPTRHSHTFWADGRFNSYDENERQVDDGDYEIVGSDVLRIGDWSWTYHVIDDQLTLDPILPTECVTPDCLDGLGWAFAVAYPGQHWTRVMAGPHVPPGSGTPN